ncbi:RnfABCDGE type electron transport complex subunit G [Clostridium botulinum]|uniref:Ion-translocating oxidoreductase complex subunit G n=1 Tax=Clostridium botulinum C/D str. DC5 TaxID=1443128 RepID=A0A0A0IC92_CLOBO|nr:RnfABCDGE type electron transport complex subunit G [Clostridium botulinum]KGM98537.1 electron transporter RnfG [Clostridium botulinum C/D str. DC5]MCD3233693.1 RnfABCDGE type electron transport complex subunit G [Clostridium botulinum D/C]MCD3239454.1 RnfABCDGE type electron transport complex subunit G [Clostridium botulinum D/C]MCD3267064.1 RnfABCDGE type electron transport complex subunit G [Clostridium botulinum D/C]MCD3298377.1 RnfABCDGE type electron transport complex subunit G [Clost
MENKNSTMETLMLGFKLLIITAIAGLVLGWAYKVTLTPIKQQEIKTNNEAMKQVLPSASNFTKIASVTPNDGEKFDMKLDANGSIKEVNKADGEGYAIKVGTKGYGGEILMMVGIGKDGKIGGIKILAHNETPGLGAKAPDKEFSGQYDKKSIDKSLKVVKATPSADNEIKAITGATITSNAVTKGVNEVVEFYNKELKGGQK